MDAFSALPKADREAFFTETAARRDLSPVIIEKDFWVCWTLLQLSRLDGIPTLLFKGGTSLSKAFGLIERFSEDIDLALDRAELGFGDENDPIHISARKKRDRAIAELRLAAHHAIENRILPALQEQCASLLDINDFSLSIDRHDAANIHFDYPPALDPEIYGSVSYIPPRILLEMGARSDHDPFEMKSVAPYVAEEFPDELPIPTATARTLSAIRTYWEKITLAHNENLRPVSPKELPNAWKRVSRHFYDIVMMNRRGLTQNALQQREILDRVILHKQRFFYSGWSRYEEAVPGSLRITPRDQFLNAMRKDYNNMQPMFFTETPSFDELIEELRQLEMLLNSV